MREEHRLSLSTASKMGKGRQTGEALDREGRRHRVFACSWASIVKNQPLLVLLPPFCSASCTPPAISTHPLPTSPTSRSQSSRGKISAMPRNKKAKAKASDMPRKRSPRPKKRTGGGTGSGSANDPNGSAKEGGEDLSCISSPSMVSVITISRSQLA